VKQRLGVCILLLPSSGVGDVFLYDRSQFQCFFKGRQATYNSFIMMPHGGPSIDIELLWFFVCFCLFVFFVFLFFLF